MDPSEPTTFFLTRLCLQRGLAFVYLIAFLIVIFQYRPLLGENGLLPARHFVERVEFRDSPSLFHWIGTRDHWFALLGWLGLGLSLFALTGLSERFGLFASISTWFLLWAIYLSFVNVGRTFYGFGWETLLLESGFLAIFLGSRDVPPPDIVIWLYRWLCFRVMFGAGLIKIRGDECWRDLTCMVYHYETQPLPNPLSWYGHRLPLWFHKAEVLWTHFVELVVPFGLFWPGLLRNACGAITILFQASLIVSGNLSWLNYVTIVTAFGCLDDAFLSRLLPFVSVPASFAPAPAAFRWATYGLGALIGALSIQPALNLFSRFQIMNTSFDPLRLVNTYGAFGSITRERYEVVMEGTSEAAPRGDSDWKEYEFKGKPGDPARRPPIVSPYHWKLDWQMWFAAMSSYEQHPWILNLAAKMLMNQKDVMALLARNPFPDAPPKHVRARIYLYRYTKPGEPGWWKREYVGPYLPPLSLDDPNFKRVLQSQGWLPAASVDRR